MNLLRKFLLIFSLVIFLTFFVTPSDAAAPDGAGPWADNVFSSSQGLMKNGLPVPAARSDPTAAVGVAENTPTVDSTFFSLGFGGNIVLGFDNGVSTGAMIVEATIEPGYPDETAKVEISEDGINWVMAGNVVQDGTVSIPAQIDCAKYVRITDTSIPANFPDDIADGYDVDGVRSTGNPCTPPQSPTPTPTSTPNVTLTPTNSPSNPNTPNTPGFPNTGGPTCNAPMITTIPSITQATRLSPTSIFVSWGPNAGLNDFLVEYGFQNGNWQFNTTVSGFSTTINNLPANQSIWIHVAAKNNCATGSFGGAVLVGGTPTTNSPGFPNTGNPCPKVSNPLVPCFPNTGGPRLPNAGIGPEDNILMNIKISIENLFSHIFKVIGFKG